MKRIRQGWNTLHRHSRSGVSLIVALCAVAVLIGLSLSIVYSSSMLLSRANRKIGRERCYQLAQSFAQVLDGELRAYTTDRTDLGAAADKIGPSDSFYRFANTVLETYGEYDPDDPTITTYYYTTGNVDGDYGQITVALRKENTSQEDPAERTGNVTYDKRVDETREIEHTTFLRYQLSVSVTAALGADSYTYTTQYYRKDSFEPIYTWDGEQSTQPFQVYWPNDGRNLFTRSKNGTDYVEPQRIGEGENAHDEIFTISYQYSPNKTTYKQYEPIYGPSGGAAGE